MTLADVPEFTARLKQLASAWPGRWFFDEGTPGAYWGPLERFDREDVWEGLRYCSGRFPDPPSAYQVAEAVRLVAANRARREADRNRRPAVALPKPASGPEEETDLRERGRRLAEGFERFAQERRGQDRGKLFFAYLRHLGVLDAKPIKGRKA